MGLSDSEKTLLVTLMDKVAENKETIGSKAVSRLLEAHEDLKSHFSHMDLTPGSSDLNTHGGKVCGALIEGVKHADNLKDHMSSLQDLHTKKLKLSNEQVQFLLVFIQEIIKEILSKDFNDDTQAACEKYFKEVASILTSS